MTEAGSRQGSFTTACRLLPRQVAGDVRALYAACRALDDIADNPSADDACGRLARARTELAEKSRSPSEEPVRLLLDLERRRGVPASDAGARLVRGVQSDLKPVRVRDFAELARYAEDVAGTVGEMMAHLLRADPRARRRAIDLGVAMQLTNVARDVREDARMGRRYLPASLLPWPMSPSETLSPANAKAVHEATLRLLELAEGHYREGERGLADMPWRNRLVVAVAARRYRAIGDVVKRNGSAGGHARPDFIRASRAMAQGVATALTSTETAR